jgi:predicted CXXCH cytochrome family protein
MKKLLVVVVVVVAIALVGASAAMAGVIGSKHDLSPITGVTYTGGTQSACAYCHTPHHSVSSAAPLWNRTLIATGYTVYGGGTTNAGSTVSQPGVNSQTCLSCHDGVIAIGEIANGTDDTITDIAGVVTDAAGVILNTAGGYIGRDLRTTHPVGVVYNSQVTKAGLSSTVASGLVNGKAWKIYNGDDATGTVECGSCHDPHRVEAGFNPFLKDALATICTDCHANK